MKKFIAVLLSLAMLISVMAIPVSAKTESKNQVKAGKNMESVFVEGENSLIVFVTGIGQSYSYLFDESYAEEGAFKKGTLQDYENYAPLIAEGKYSARWNLFNTFDEAFENKETILAIVFSSTIDLLEAFSFSNLAISLSRLLSLLFCFFFSSLARS